MSRTRVICPPLFGSNFTMIFSNSATVERSPSTSIVSWKSPPGGVGGMPICPAATHVFCCWMAAITSLGISERCNICSRIKPDAHAVLADAEDVHVRHPGNAREFVAQLECREVAQEERVILIVRRGERDDLQDGGGFFLRHHALLLDGLRQLRECGGNAVLHQHLREVEVRPRP